MAGCLHVLVDSGARPLWQTPRAPAGAEATLQGNDRLAVVTVQRAYQWPIH